MTGRTTFTTLAASAALGLVLTGCNGSAGDKSGASSSSTSPATSSTAASTPTQGLLPGRTGDIMFAQMMIPHHEQAVEMSDMALAKRDASSKVKNLATQIKKAQGPEIKKMQGWLNAWGAPVDPSKQHEHTANGGPPSHANGEAEPMMKGMMSEKDMSTLKGLSGKKFDDKWLSMMIAHHSGAIDSAREVSKSTKDAEVKKLAEDIVVSQQKEIDTMKKDLGAAGEAP